MKLGASAAGVVQTVGAEGGGATVNVDDKYAFMAQATSASTAAGAADAAWDD